LELNPSNDVVLEKISNVRIAQRRAETELAAKASKYKQFMGEGERKLLQSNLEEALTWVERSITGGYNGFAANKNFVNLTTKASIQQRLNKLEELQKTITDAFSISGPAYEINTFSMFLIRNEKFKEALKLNDIGLKKHPNTWYLMLNHGLANYFLGKKKAAIKMLAKSLENTPKPYQEYVKKALDDVKKGDYSL
jgi:tetratricopeptide (TPR) repeat protein